MFLRQLYEQPRVAVMAFGRMNPPTIGHQKLVDKVKSVDGDHYVFLSQTQKPKTDPLDFIEKLRYAKFFFPAVSLGHDSVKTPIQALQKLQELGYTDIVFVAGSDRVEGFQKLFDTYNGQPDKSGNIPFKFNSIKVVSAGERDPDADGAEGMSASKMRQAAADGDLDTFRQGVPRAELADEMFASVRKGMGIKDEMPVEESEQDVNKAYKTYVQLKRFENQMAVSKASSDYTMSLGNSSQKLKADIAKLEKQYPQFIKMYADRVQKSKASMAQASTGLAQRIKDFDESIGSDVRKGMRLEAKVTESVERFLDRLTEAATADDATALKKAIKDFQTKAGIQVDGQVGPETRAAFTKAMQTQAGGGAEETPAQGQEAPTAGPDDGTRGGQQPNAPAQATPEPTAGPDDGTRGGQQPNATAPAQEPTAGPDDGTRGGQQPNAPASEPEAPAAQEPAAEPEAEKPAAQPKVSKELYMQKAPDRNASLANFNVKQMKAEYPEPYLDIPNDDGTVTRAYGPKANLEDFIANDKRGKGLKLSGSGGATPAAEPEQSGTTDVQNDADSADSATPAPDDGTRGGQEPAQTTPTDGAEQPGQVASQAGEPTSADDEAEAGQDDQSVQGQEPETPRTKIYKVNGQDMSGNDISKRINELLKKAGITGESAFRSAIARVLTEALTDAEKKELQDLVNAVQGEEYFKTFLDKVSEKLKSAGINYGGQSAPTQDPTSGPDDGSRGEPQAQSDASGEDDFQSDKSYTLDGKPATRDEYEKAFGKDVDGRAKDYEKLKRQIEGLAKQAQDEKRKWTQGVLNDPDSPYYKEGVPTEPEDPDYPKELVAIDDKYKAKGERLQKMADELIADPDVKKYIDDGGKDDFDKLLSGDDDKWDDLFKTDAPEGNKTTTGSTKSSDSSSTSTRSSSSTSSVTRTGGQSKTVSTSGGGSTTRFSARYRATDESKELKAQARAVRKEEMKAFRDNYDKENPNADRFDFAQDPGYEALEKKREDLLQQARDAREMIHPSGEMDSEGNIKYYGKGANKDGTWDGEQFDPNRK